MSRFRSSHPIGNIGSSAERIVSLVVLLTVTLLLPAPASAEDYVHLRLDMSVSDFVVSNQTDRIVYLKITEDSDGDRTVHELISVTVTGGQRKRLAHCISDSEQEYSLEHLSVSPDGKLIAYVQREKGSQAALYTVSFYIVPTRGGEATRLQETTIPEDSWIGHMQFSPNGDYLIYHIVYEDSGPGGSGQVDFFSVPVSGGEPVRFDPRPILDQTLIYRWSDWQEVYRFSADGTHVVYLANSDREPEHQFANVLASVPIGGGKAVQFRCAQEFTSMGQSSLAGKRHYIIAGCVGGHVSEFYSTPVLGGDSVRLSEPYELSASAFSIPLLNERAVFGDRFVYRRWNDAYKRREIVSVPAGGGPLTELVVGDDPFDELTIEVVTPDGNYVLYTGVEKGDSVLYSTPASHSESIRLKSLKPDHSRGFLIAPDNERVILVEQYVSPVGFGVPSNSASVSSIPIRGGSPVVLDNHSDFSELESVRFSPDGKRMLYESVSTVPIDGGTPTVISTGAKRYEYAPDGESVVYIDANSNLSVYTQGSSQYLPSVLSP